MDRWLVETLDMDPGFARGLQFVIALVVVLLLIALFVWVLRRFSGVRMAKGGRQRQPRLAIMDAAHVDNRRRLVLIRRDNVEHLLLIGGPSDVVVEQTIVRGMPVAGHGRPPQPDARGTAGGNAPTAPGRAATAGRRSIASNAAGCSAGSGRARCPASRRRWQTARAAR